MKIVVADLFSPEGLAEMKKMGHNVVYEPKAVDAAFVELMRKEMPTLLVVRSKKVTKAVIDVDPKLEMVIRAGAGYDTIDVDYCSAKGIYVCNCPGKNNVAVAELAMGLIVCLDRRIPENVQLLKEGKWEKGLFAECIGLKGRTVGLLGIGAVGREVCKRCLAFEMNVIAYDPYLPPEAFTAMGATRVMSVQEIATKSDIISLHVPATKETLHMINKAFLATMKPDAVMINTARGDLVVEEDLIAHLNEMKDFYYACDVIQGEPAAKKAPFESQLAKHPKVFATHHIGASTKQAESAIGVEAVRMVKEYGTTKTVCNCVNMATDIKVTHKISVKYASSVGILGAIMAVFTPYNLRIEEVRNEVFKERHACVAGINFTGPIDKKDEIVATLAKIGGVLDVTFIC